MSEYNTNQDGQWKTSDQWRAEEANDHSNPKKNKNGGRGKYVAKLAASAVAFGLIAGLVMQGVTYGFSRAGIGNGATQLQQRRQQAAVQVPAVMTSQAYQKMLCHRSYRSQESSRQQARVGLDRHKAVNPKVLVQVSSLARKMVRF